MSEVDIRAVSDAVARVVADNLRHEIRQVSDRIITDHRTLAANIEHQLHEATGRITEQLHLLITATAEATATAIEAASSNTRPWTAISTPTSVPGFRGC